MSLLSSSGSAADIGAIEALFVLFAGNAYQSVRTVPGGRLVSVGRFVMPPGVAEGDVPVIDGDYCVDMLFRNPISSLLVCVRNLKISIGVSGRLDNSIVLTEVPTCGDSRSWFSALSAIFYVVPLVFGVLVLLPGDESPCESESMHTVGLLARDGFHGFCSCAAAVEVLVAVVDAVGAFVDAHDGRLAEWVLGSIRVIVGDIDVHGLSLVVRSDDEGFLVRVPVDAIA